MATHLSKIAILLSSAVISLSTHANPVFVPVDVNPDGTLDLSKAGVLGDLLNNSMSLKKGYSGACHTHISVINDIKQYMDADTTKTYNQNVCVQLRSGLPESQKMSTAIDIKRKCESYASALAPLHLTPEQATITQPTSCPTQHLVALCHLPTHKVFVYDTLLANSNDQKACKQAKVTWIELPAKQDFSRK